MDNNWAAENLSLIRTLMERSALYRRALTPIMFYVGTLGTTAGLVGAAAVPTTAFGFGLYWGIVGIAGMAGAFLLARRQAMKDAEPFWSAPTRHVAQALLPAFTLGALVAVLTVLAPGSRSASHWSPILPSVWMGLYGCALVSAGFFMRRGIRVLGWVFIAGSGVLTAGLFFVPDFLAWESRFAHGLMGAAFGVLHLLCGVYLQLSRDNHGVL